MVFNVVNGFVRMIKKPAKLEVHLKRLLRYALVTVVLLTGIPCCFLHADEAGLEFFEKKIRPVLVEHCYECHAEGAEKIRGGLLLDTREGMHRGGDSGPAVLPEKPEDSLLLDAIRYETFEMPPDGPLPDEVVADFERWISLGASDPRDGPAKQIDGEIDIEAGRRFWSFQPSRTESVPEVSDAEWPRSDVDQFILANLEAKGLKPVGDADRGVLIRRAYYALIGLPPSVDEIDEFVNDSAPLPEAFATVVDRLLESEHFGERWGRHWLDVARFAESSGGGRSLLFPEAWRYRDYVIEAFNKDLPYDQFIMQQIAGDLMEADDWQQRSRNITATAFLVLGPTNYELQDKEVLEMDIVDEQLATIGRGLLGMTVGCARCHDHKFDPIPMQDYYALAGILKSTKSVIHSNVSKWNTSPLPLPQKESEALQTLETQVAALQIELNSLKAAFKKAGGDLDSLGDARAINPALLSGLVVDDSEAVKKGKWTSSRSEAGFVGKGYLFSSEEESHVTFEPKLPESGKYEVQITYTSHANRSSKVPVHVFYNGGEEIIYVDQKQPGSVERTIHSLGTFEFDAGKNPRVIVTNVGAAKGAVIADAVLFMRIEENGAPQAKAEEDELRYQLANKIKASENEIKHRQAELAKRPTAMAVVDRDEVADIPLAIRGVVHNAGPIVRRGVLQVVSTGENPAITEQQSGRMELARWIASSENPLTARIMVNRIWHWLFGQGLVRTVDNFGSTGELPSHPELLDYLAQQFVADGWAVKRMIRRLMLSRVYQLSSVTELAAEAVDPGNKLYWRMNRQRLDAESIRDTLLLLGGNLDLSAGGSNIKADTKSEYGYQFDSMRRSVYEPVFRNELSSIFENFDFADPNIQVGKRTRSTTAPQALLLMNHPLVMEQARAAAERLLSSKEMTNDQRIVKAYRQTLGRSPSDREVELARRFVGDQNDVQRWGLFVHALFQSLDFRFLD